MPVTIRFLDYAFNENIHNMFSQMGSFPDTPFIMTDTKIKEHIYFES